MDFGATYPDRYYRLIYEQLVFSPQETLGSLMTWLAETLEPEQINFNQVPHQQGLDDPKIAHTAAIETDRIGRWQAILTDAEAITVWHETTALWTQIDPDHQYAFISSNIS